MVEVFRVRSLFRLHVIQTKRFPGRLQEVGELWASNAVSLKPSASRYCFSSSISSAAPPSVIGGLHVRMGISVTLPLLCVSTMGDLGPK